MSTICIVSRGDQPLDFSWYFNGEKLLLDGREGLSIATSRRKSVLEIEAVNAEHAGEYSCSVFNEAGATSHSATLVVNGKLIDNWPVKTLTLLLFVFNRNNLEISYYLLSDFKKGIYL